MPRLLKLIVAVMILAGAPALAQTAEPTRLDAVLNRGTLRVGTTGDYKPFTYLNPATNAFEGIDIDMANALGRALGAKVEFVKTSWPTLMADFLADKFDIAMGGVSINLDRQKKAMFSHPYLVDGKAPIARCADKEKYRELADIDRPGVRVIVNPGGTNERFARANIKQATIIVYDDNVTIFDQIVANKADVMITDAIETLLQQKLRPSLCAVRPTEPFNFSEKAYMLPRDMVFKEFVDQWLRLAFMTKEYQTISDKWLK